MEQIMKNLTKLKQTVALSFISSTVLLTPLMSEALTVEEVIPNSKMLATDIVETFHVTSLQYRSGNYNRGTFDPTTTEIFDFNSSGSNNSNNHSLGKISLLLITIGVVMLCLVEAIKWLQKREGKVFINPYIRKKSLDRSNLREIHCAKCRQPMARVKLIQLSKPQQVAKRLGSVTFRGYQCSKCSDRNSYSLISYISNSSRYQVCPHCHELTATRTETTLKEATHKNKGKVLISDRCYCCDYCQEKTKNISRLRPPSNGGGSNGNISSNYYFGGMAGDYGSDGSSGGNCDGGGGGSC
jgi:uncharacterized protein